MSSTSGGPGGTSASSGAWGPTSRGGGGRAPTYSSITAINTSVRNKKNILEVRLEKQQGANFHLSVEEIESLLKRLSIDSSQLEGVSACPEGKPVVFITLHPSVDITKFLYRNESYMVKEGVRTTTIRPEGRKEKVIKITGLHPNTKDQAVVNYLAAHGKVSSTEKVIHHVFPGEAGSSLLAGKLNGNRSYVVELTIPMASYHIIDGEKVSVRYSGQEWTCAKCHQLKSVCPGAAVARNCTAERVLLSTYMEEHWNKIGYKPDTANMNEVDNMELEVQVGGNSKNQITIPESGLTSKYTSVIIKGFKPDTPLEGISQVLNQEGFLTDLRTENILRNDKSGNLTIVQLKPEECLMLMDKLNRKTFLGRQLYVTSVVAESPNKAAPAVSVTSTPSATIQNKAVEGSPSRLSGPLCSGRQQGQGAVDEVADKGVTGPVPSPSPITSPNQSLSLNPKLIIRSSSVPGSCRNSSSMETESLTDFVWGPISPNVQEKIDILEQQGAGSKFFNMTPLENKRKSESSPEIKALSKKGKKQQKSEEKKLRKLESKAVCTLEVKTKTK